jgi:hypothetical protein
MLSVDSDWAGPEVLTCNQLLSNIEFGISGKEITRPLHIRRAVFMQNISHWDLRQAFGSHAVKLADHSVEIHKQPVWLLKAALFAEAAFGLMLLIGFSALIADMCGAMKVTVGMKEVAAGMLSCTGGWFVSHRIGYQWYLGVQVLTKIRGN